MAKYSWNIAAYYNGLESFVSLPITFCSSYNDVMINPEEESLYVPS
jgi:hypothetical protein